jgi:hypothetical protein
MVAITIDDASTDSRPLVVERTMRWSDLGQYGAHTEKAVASGGRKWYFAEGSQGFFSTYLLLTNLTASANRAIVDWLLEGWPPVRHTRQDTAIVSADDEHGDRVHDAAPDRVGAAGSRLRHVSVWLRAWACATQHDEIDIELVANACSRTHRCRSG